MAASGNARLDQFLRRIAHLGTNRRLDAMFNECVEVGGCWLGPELTPHWPTTHQIEIHMHGIIGVGPTDDDAIRSWIGAARRTVQGYTPTGHTNLVGAA